jgi:hypothetical protein
VPTAFFEPCSAAARPKGAFYSEQLREFILPYDVVRAAEMPDETLFLQRRRFVDGARKLS